VSHPGADAARAAALDPSTDARSLAAIAHEHPSLRAVVASHPNAYPALLDWLDAQGDPVVSAVVAGRRPAGQNEQVAASEPAASAGPAVPVQAQASTAPVRPPEAADASAAPAKPGKPGKPTRRARKQGGAKRYRGLLAGALALVAVGLAGGGFAGGWLLSERYASQQSLPQATPSVVLVPQVPEGVRMPDLRGLSRNDALQVIADAGWDPSTVTFTTEPFAGAEGTVVAQSPTFGVTEVGAISLTLSAAAVMPATTGRDGTELVTELRNLGVNVAITYDYDPSVDAGKVISVDPRPGAALPADATVTIAESGTARFLSSVQCPDGCLSATSELTLDGTPFSDSVYGSVAYDTWDEKVVVGSHVYQLGRHADRFVATLGVPDDVSETGGTLAVTLVGDGKELARFTVDYGSTREVDVPVTGVLRLVIRSSFTKKPPDGLTSQQFALGDARVVGADAEIAQLEQR
jgi:Uncharacterized protein conserved in bacteria